MTTQTLFGGSVTYASPTSVFADLQYGVDFAPTSATYSDDFSHSLYTYNQAATHDVRAICVGTSEDAASANDFTISHIGIGFGNKIYLLNLAVGE